MIARNTHLRRNIVLAGFVLLCLMTGVAQAAQVRAWLDRSSMQLGETVTLNIEVTDDSGASQPDFSALKNDFNLLGTQSSTSMSIMNGQASSKMLWAVGLEPKKGGTFTIPALNVAGAQTAPLSLTVQPGSTSSGKAGDDVFLEVAVEPKTPYVQQQVRLTMKLFYALNLTDGVVEDPHGEGLISHKLGQDAAYTADVEGRRYHVLERHYALSAEKSGALTLAPITFRGHAVNPSDINSFFNHGRAITAQAPAVAFDVRARPATSGTDTWLPAHSLTLTADGVDASTQGKVGEPLTLTLRLRAQGLGFEQLPELKLPKIDGADIYPDKETTQNKDDGSWVYGERERKFAIVPNRPGTLHIPQLGVSWWDTEHDKAASSDVATLALNVVPATAANIAQNAVSDAAPAATGKLAPAHVAGATAAPGKSDDTQLRLWRTLAIAAIALWLATLVGFATWRRRTGNAPRPQSHPATDAELEKASAASKAFLGACARDDAQSAARALLAWARTRGVAVRSLGELAAKLTDAEQRDALTALERGLYAGAPQAGATAIGKRLAEAFRRDLSLSTGATRTGNEGSVLPPLYPAT
jgi:hypothetical protein